MCGISGLVCLNKNISISKYILKMNEFLKHRGPDDEGYLFLQSNGDIVKAGGIRTPKHVFETRFPYTPDNYFTGNLPVDCIMALGHNRLSIIDPSAAGHQPMCNIDESIWVIFNGEIYNYIELRDELKGLGHNFVSLTDTEVLLHSYEEWGENCLDRFNGMWAFVIYDKKQHKLFGSRDRFGVKPLYYTFDKETGLFAFASEIKAIVKSLPNKNIINPEVLFDYLVMRFVEPIEGTFFKNIEELQPSYSFSFDLSTFSFHKRKYYSIDFSEIFEKIDFKKCSKYHFDVHEHIFSSIKLRLRADVPFGSCLSGGIDSSSIVCVINALLGENNPMKQHVFTASWNQTELDESRWAKIVVDHCNAMWHQVSPSFDDFILDMEDLIYTQDVPFISTSIYAQYCVMRLAKQKGVSVLLDGQGGDELFAGYTNYYCSYLYELLKNFSFIRCLSAFLDLKNAPIKPMQLLSSIMKEFIIFNTPISYWQSFLTNYYQKDFIQKYKDRLTHYKSYRFLTINQLSRSYMTGHVLKGLLRYEDRNSMRFSIESRTPFADDIFLIETVARIPGTYKIQNGWSKYFLRTAVKNLLPKEITTRTDKMGFDTPENVWLNGIKESLKGYFTNDLEEYLNLSLIEKDWDKLFLQNRIGLTTLWTFVNFAIWKKVYNL